MELIRNIYDPNEDIPDLNGKVYIVTGSTAGIGFGIAAHLLQHNAAKIVLLSNQKEHATESIKALEEYGDTSRVRWLHCNLANLVQTDEVAKKLKREDRHVDALILNAGIGIGEYELSEDGIESHFQINLLSQLHLALTLLPNLDSTADLRNAPSRIVFMSSDLHRFSPPATAFASVEEINTDVGPTRLYNRSKLAQVLVARLMARRLDAGKLGTKKLGSKASIYVNATHPGGVSTDQQEQAVDAYGLLGKIGVTAVRPFMKDPVKDGCRSALFAATSPEVIDGNGIQGCYIVPDKQVTSPSDEAQDDVLGERMWNLSQDILEGKLGKQEYGFSL